MIGIRCMHCDVIVMPDVEHTCPGRQEEIARLQSVLAGAAEGRAAERAELVALRAASRNAKALAELIDSVDPWIHHEAEGHACMICGAFVAVDWRKPPPKDEDYKHDEACRWAAIQRVVDEVLGRGR